MDQKIAELEQRIQSLEARVTELEKGAAAGTTANVPDRNDKNYEVVREIVNLLTQRRLLIHEAYTILNQAKAVLGYTKI